MNFSLPARIGAVRSEMLIGRESIGSAKVKPKMIDLGYCQVEGLIELVEEVERRKIDIESRWLIKENIQSFCIFDFLFGGE